MDKCKKYHYKKIFEYSIINYEKFDKRYDRSIRK
jgi:hypothetical protein